MKYPHIDWSLRLRLLNAGINDKIKANNRLRDAVSANTKDVSRVSRASFITSAFIGHEFEVHNGMRYVRVKVLSEMVGHRFGEFVNTTIWASPKLAEAKSKVANNAKQAKAKPGARK